jgi:hypothetical protein
MFPEMQVRHQGFAVGGGRAQTDAFRHKMFERASKSNLSAHKLGLRKEGACQRDGAPAGSPRALRRQQSHFGSKTSLTSNLAEDPYQKIAAAKHPAVPSA